MSMLPPLLQDIVGKLRPREGQDCPRSHCLSVRGRISQGPRCPAVQHPTPYIDSVPFTGTCCHSLALKTATHFPEAIS